jgi:hypothetical protein
MVVENAENIKRHFLIIEFRFYIKKQGRPSGAHKIKKLNSSVFNFKGTFPILPKNKANIM